MACCVFSHSRGLRNERAIPTVGARYVPTVLKIDWRQQRIERITQVLSLSHRDRLYRNSFKRNASCLLILNESLVQNAESFSSSWCRNLFICYNNRDLLYINNWRKKKWRQNRGKEGRALPIQASRGLIQAYKSIEWICVHHPIRREMRQRTRIGKLG